MKIGELIFRLMTVLCFILLTGTAIMWVRSLWVEDGFKYQSGSVIRGINSCNGALSFTVARNFADPTGGPRTPAAFYGDEGLEYFRFPEGPEIPFQWRKLGFGFRDIDVQVIPGETVNMKDLYVPDWSFVTVFSIMPVRYLIRLICRRQIGPSSCRQCGYDLRAHMPGDRCPECGTVIPGTSTATIPSDSRSQK